MNIQVEKLGLIDWILQIKDASVIQKLNVIKEENSKSLDWWDTLNKEEIESIERGLENIKEGKVHSHESAKKLYEAYL